jgi:hypothetical protein
MNRKEVTGRLVEAGIEVKDGKVKKSDIMPRLWCGLLRRAVSK